MTTGGAQTPGQADRSQGGPSHGARQVHLVVCGEPSRGDDGAALAALARVPADVLALAHVHTTGDPDPAVLAGIPDTAACVVADAVAGVAPGEVVTLALADVGAGAGRTAGERNRLRSTHTLPLADVLALAAEIRGSPLEGCVVGVGISGTALGAGLSPAVQAALPAFAAALGAAISFEGGLRPPSISPLP